MGLFSRLTRRKALTASPAVVEALQDRRFNPYPPLGGTNLSPSVVSAFQRGVNATYGWMYATQPAVRTVVDYIATNFSQLELCLYEKVSDVETAKRDDHPAAQTLAHPDGQTPAAAFIERFVKDFLVYDNAYGLKLRPGPQRPLTLIRLPPDKVTVSGGRFTPSAYTVWRSDGSYFNVNPDDMIHWFGYNPDDPLLGLSKLETLRQELAADGALQAAVVELAKSGLKGGWIGRPLEAPEWDQDDAERFTEKWRQQKARRDGRDPVLEEGMEYHDAGVTPKDAGVNEARQFTREEVAREYGMEHCPPEDEDERRQFYAEVLSPLTKSLAGVLGVDILEREYQETSFYFDFNLDEKLRGDPENRYPANTSAVGRAWITVNEIRAREGLPPIDTGDALTVPLNIMLEGPGSPSLPAPNVMPPQDPNGPPQDGSYRQSAGNGLVKADRLTQLRPRLKADMARQRRNVSELQGLLLRFYERQAKAIRGKSTFDSDRWNEELTKDLHDALTRMVEREGALYAGTLGGNDFDMRQVKNYVRAMAGGIAKALNDVTQRDLESGTATDAIDRAMNERAAIAGANIGARATVFARREAAKQAPDSRFRMQTWIADTERHAELDGVSVPLGSDWGGIEPGSEPNCACSVAIT